MCSLRFENNLLTIEGVRFASISKKTPLSKLSFALVSLALPLLGITSRKCHKTINVLYSSIAIERRRCSREYGKNISYGIWERGRARPHVISQPCLGRLTSINDPMRYLDVISLYETITFPKSSAPPCSCIASSTFQMATVVHVIYVCCFLNT